MQEETKKELNTLEEDKFKATPLILTTTKLRKQIKDTKSSLMILNTKSMVETNLGTTTLTSPTDGQTITVSKTSPLYKKYTGLGWAQAPVAPATPPPTTGGGEDEFNLDNLTEGLVSPMDMPDVRQSSRFEVAKGMLEEQAAATFDPQILRQKGTGRSQVSSAQGISGQRLGQNLSSAELAYIGNVQAEAEDRVKAIERQKQAYISEGLFDLAESLTEQQIQMYNLQNNLVMQKASLALQLRGQEQSEKQFEQTFGLSEKQFTENQKQFQDNLAISMANLTGEFEGSPTFAAKQAEISNALQEAGITGYYNGEKTLQATIQDAQLKLQERGIDIDEARLKETIRANKVQENLARARLAQAGAESTQGGELDLTDLTFNEAKNKVAQYAADLGTQLDQSTWSHLTGKLADKYLIQGDVQPSPEDFEAFNANMEDLTRSKRTDAEATESLFGGDGAYPEAGEEDTNANPNMNMSEWASLNEEGREAMREQARQDFLSGGGKGEFNLGDWLKDNIKGQRETRGERAVYDDEGNFLYYGV